MKEVLQAIGLLVLLFMAMAVLTLAIQGYLGAPR